MKRSVITRNGITPATVTVLSRLVAMIPWPDRRQAMGESTLSLLEGKPRVAEAVFGWSRQTVQVGMHERQTGLTCVNDLSTRRRPKTEDKEPELLAELCRLIDPTSQAHPQVRTPLAYTQVTAKTVHAALEQQGGAVGALPTVRTISNILNRQGYRLRSVAKTQVQKKTPDTAPSSPTFGKPTSGPMPVPTR